MSTLAELEASYVAAKQTWQEDKTEDNFTAMEAWAAVVSEARQIVRTALPNYEGYTADQRASVRLENLGWEP
jgi:hypothetical protein